MLSLTSQEKAWVRSLQFGKQNLPVKEWLEAEYFKESLGRALIIQCTQNFAVLFLKEDLYKNETKRKEENSKFLQLISFLKKMQHQGYLTFSRGKSTRLEAMFFVQDKFLTPKPSAGPIVLNEKGDFTENPELIHDQNRKVIYEGIRFDHDYFDLIQSYCTGEVIISPDIKNALQPKVEEKVAPPTPIAKPTPIKKEEPKPVPTKQEEPKSIPPQAETKTESKPKPKPEAMANKTTFTKKEKPSDKKRSNKALEIITLCLLILFIVAVGFGGYYQHQLLSQLHQHQHQSDSTSTEYVKHFEARLGNLERVSKDHLGHAFNSSSKADTFYGIDVSKWNGDITEDLNSNDDLTFVICKATQGADYVDPEFESNWSTIKEKNLIRGAYHFYVSRDNPIDQAEHFAHTLGELGDHDIAPVLDIETGSVESGKEVDTTDLQIDLFMFLKHLEKLTGRKPIVYSSVYFADTHLKNKRFAQYPLWIADYTTASEPEIPTVWKEQGYKFWQKSDSHEVEGDKTDYDQFIGHKEEITQ